MDAPAGQRSASRGWTLLAVALCWAVFRSTSLSDAANYMGLLFGSSGVAFDAMAKSYLVNGGGVMALATFCYVSTNHFDAVILFWSHP